MIDWLAARLMRLAPLSEDDRYALARLADRAVEVDAHTNLASVGDHAETAVLVLEGIACRSVRNATGNRCILALLLPGDLCDPDLLHLGRWDHDVEALTPCRVVHVSRAALEDVTATYPTVAMALRKAKLEAEARARVWLAGLSISTATARLARLLCEIADRSQVGVDRREGGTLPALSIEDLAACIGTTTVHVNRTLQDLLRSRLVERGSDGLRILDRPGLEKLIEV